MEALEHKQGSSLVPLQVFCVGGLVASAISLNHTLENLPAESAIDPTIESRIDDIADLNYDSLLFNARAASATGIAISLVVIIYEIVPIVLRFLNIGLINYKIKIFLGIVSAGRVDFYVVHVGVNHPKSNGWTKCGSQKEMAGQIQYNRLKVKFASNNKVLFLQWLAH